MVEPYLSRRRRAAADGSHEYEYRMLTFTREVSRAEVRRTLGEQAEYDHWELARTVVYVGGVRRAWLRRRVVRVQRTA